MNKKKIISFVLLEMFMTFLIGINIMTGNVLGLVASIMAALWDLWIVIDTLYKTERSINQ